MPPNFRTFLFDESVVNVPFLRAERKPQALILQAFLLASMVGLIQVKKLQVLTGLTPIVMLLFCLAQFGMYGSVVLFWLYRRRADRVMVPSTLIAVHANLALFAGIISAGGVPWTPLWGAFLLYIAMIINAFSFQPYLLLPITVAGLFPAAYHSIRPPEITEFWTACLIFTAAGLVLYGMIGSTVNNARRLRIAGAAADFNRRLADEKYRLSREIHDGIGSSLSDVRMLVDMASKKSGAAQELRLREAQEALTEGISGLRKLMYVLEEKECRFSDVSENLQKKIRRLDQTGFRVECSSLADDPDRLIPSPIVVHILRIAQEALSNVQKHAGATTVELRVTLRRSRIGLVIADDGRGFTASQELSCGYGLRNMRDRCEELGGSFLLDTQPGQGTRIEIEFPLEPGGSVG